MSIIEDKGTGSIFRIRTAVKYAIENIGSINYKNMSKIPNI